jgi:chlorobactene glucosyltransferase
VAEFRSAAIDRLSAAALAVAGGTLLANLLWFRRPHGRLPEHAPFVSVLVAARNEERTIERCVRSLLAQTYPAFEVLVLDDRSEDGTRALLQQLEEEVRAAQEAGSRVQPCLRVLKGKPLPAGWSGKNWACHQLASVVDPASQFLLFTDADTVHRPGALPLAVAEALRADLDLLSLMPQQITRSWSEVLVVGLFPLQILVYLPLPAMERLPIPSMAAANGQYLLFRRASYERTGGHAAISGQVAEDVGLAQQVKREAGRVRLANGMGLVSCRMYFSLGEVIAGFRRSFSAGLRLYSPLVLFIAAFNFLAFMLPFLRLGSSPVAARMALVVLGLRTLLAWRTGAATRGALAHPLGMALLLWIQSLALVDFFFDRPLSWKGRAYEQTVLLSEGVNE